MTWARIDDHFHGHPKVASLGPYMLACVGLHALAISWCTDQLTDGLIPTDQVPRLAGDLALLLPKGQPGELVNRLVAVGMWEETQGGYRIHDFLDYNPSKREVLQLRKTRALSGQAGGRQRASNMLAKLQAKPQANAKQKSTPNPYPVPVPVPVPNPNPSPGERTGRGQAALAAVDHPIREFLGFYQERFEARFGGKPNLQGGKDAKLVQGLLQRYGDEALRHYLVAFLDSDDDFIQHSGYTLGVFSVCLNKVIVQGGDGQMPRLMPRTQANLSALHRFVSNLQGGTP